MRSKLVTGLALMGALLIGLAGVASAIEEFATRAYVVSVDQSTKSMTLRQKVGQEFKNIVVRWDDKTEWQRTGEHVWEKKPATVDLAKELKKDSKVYVMVTNEDGPSKLRLLKLTTLGPDEVVD